ncbi:protein SKIP34 [Euphorbia lathyris]|uniref:protein SKIP34 n=1 Tax=Euphorbia lathyris TaxID=212925 RepID=UPI003313AFD9
MCYGHQRSVSLDDLISSRNRRSQNDYASAVEHLLARLAQTEALLDRARAREAELTRCLDEMKRFVSVMEILESYLKRRFHDQQQHVSLLLSPVSA